MTFVDSRRLAFQLIEGLIIELGFATFKDRVNTTDRNKIMNIAIRHNENLSTFAFIRNF